VTRAIARRHRAPAALAAAGLGALAVAGCAIGSDDAASTATTAPPPPTYSLMPIPAQNLTDGQVVFADGHGFVAGETVLLAQCAHEVVAEGSKACDTSTVVKTTVDAHGNISQNFTVHRHVTVVIGADRTVVDCGERPTRCNLSGAAATDATRASGSGIIFAPATEDTAVTEGTSDRAPAGSTATAGR
jgi:hypothetical protein